MNRNTKSSGSWVAKTLALLATATSVAAGTMACGGGDVNVPAPEVTVVVQGGGSDAASEEPACTVGSEGCSCHTGDVQCDGETLQCVGGICQKPPCPTGDKGCSCLANSTCNKKSDGSWLVCDTTGVCVDAPCKQGEAGCGCFPGNTCTAGLVCSTDTGAPVCQAATCTLGALSCPCNADRTCGKDTDGTGLVCNGQTCTRPTCTAGSVMCGCRTDLTCDAGLVCGGAGVCVPVNCPVGTLNCPCHADSTCATSDMTCAANGLCTVPTCKPGGEGCPCKPDASCSSSTSTTLLCQSNVCVACSGASCVRIPPIVIAQIAPS